MVFVITTLHIVKQILHILDLSPLLFHINFRLDYQIAHKHPIRILILTVLNQYTNLEKFHMSYSIVLLTINMAFLPVKLLENFNFGQIFHICWIILCIL